MKKRDMSWGDNGIDCYVGHNVSEDSVYIGGPYYDNHAQINKLTYQQAKWIRKHLLLAMKRCKDKKSVTYKD